MPTYVFQCKQCEQHFSKFLKMDERNKPIEQPCPNCDTSGEIERVLTGAVLVYQPDGQLRTSDNFNDRLKQIKKIKGGNGLIPTTIQTR